MQQEVLVLWLPLALGEESNFFGWAGNQWQDAPQASGGGWPERNMVKWAGYVDPPSSFGLVSSISCASVGSTWFQGHFSGPATQPLLLLLESGWGSKWQRVGFALLSPMWMSLFWLVRPQKVTTSLDVNRFEHLFKTNSSHWCSPSLVKSQSPGWDFPKHSVLA